MLVAMILGGVMAGVTEALASVPRTSLGETQAATFAFVLRAAGIGEQTEADQQETQKEADEILPN